MCKRLFTTTYYLQLPTKSTTYNYLSTVTLHNLFTLYTFDNIGAGLCMVRIGKGGYSNVPYDITINVLWLFFTAPWVGLQFVIVVFPDHTYLLFADISPSF